MKAYPKLIEIMCKLNNSSQFDLIQFDKDWKSFHIIVFSLLYKLYQIHLSQVYFRQKKLYVAALMVLKLNCNDSTFFIPSKASN